MATNPPPTIFINEVTFSSSTDPAVTFWNWSADVDVADFAAADFTDPTSGRVGVAVFQNDTNILEVDMSGPVVNADVAHYAGTAPGVITPQSATFDDLG